ncbi:MAG TPA: glycosyltransferase family 4 protein [Methylomirabilota bacterium]|nr:glycosyltransferase family 4 protein [Methylomirabilota bacterium]
MDRTRPLRIVHCVRSPIGGIFRHIADLATAQAQSGHQVGIICDSTTGGAFEARQIEDLAPRLPFGIHRYPMQRAISPSDLRLTLSLVDRLRGLDLDVLHGHGAKGGAHARVIGTILRLGGRRVVRIYCPHGGSLHFDADTAEGRTYFRLERMLERATDALVFVSDYEAEMYRRKVCPPSTHFRRVYNGLKPEEFAPLRPREGMADLMFAGMMRDLKGPQILIEALPVLAATHGLTPTVRFVGAGEDRVAYEARVAALGLADRVTFHDPMPTRQALSQGRILVVPSLAESMPYLVLEAVAARIPMVATRVGGVPEIFADRSARLVPPQDPKALAAGIAAVLTHEAGARADAEEFGADITGRFSIARMSSDIEALYYDLLIPRRPTVVDTSSRPAPIGRLTAGGS